MLQLEPGVRAALDEVQAKGRVDGNEHACIVHDGFIVWRGDGEPDSVDVHDAPRGPGYIGVHNHPVSLNSLSNGDLSALFRHDVDAIYAVSGEDGSIYKASKPRDKWSALQWVIAFDRVRSDLIRNGDGPRYFESSDQSRYFNSAHWVNRLMGAVGVFDYEYELGEVMQRKVLELDARMGFDRLIENFKANVGGNPEILVPMHTVVGALRAMLQGLVKG